MRISPVYQLCTAVVVLSMCMSASATYIAWNKKPAAKVHHKSNHIDNNHIKRYGSSFKHDWDIQKYLKLYGTDMLLWRCRNAIQPYWNWKPLPRVDLYCEAIGSMKSVSWYHNGKEVDIELKKYRQSVVPHFSHGHYFSRWIDFRLKIYNATMADSGLYTFKVTSPHGTVAQQMIYLDISEKKKKRKGRKRKYNRRSRDPR